VTRLLALTAVLGVALVMTGAALADGPPATSFYVDGTLYRTIGTPTDLSGTGAPAHSFDTIYEFSGNQRNVATAAPGDAGYNGGRWRVEVLGFPSGYAATVASADANGSGDIDSAAELDTAFAAGTAVVAGAGPSFVCPVIKVPGA
jgi:hypothetical protein